MRRIGTLLALSAVAATTTLTVVVTAASAADSVQATGKVMQVVDGDTLDVDIAGDGTSTPVRVRVTGIQATETAHIGNDLSVDSCHSNEARQRLQALVNRKTVRLMGLSSASTNEGRQLRSLQYKNSSGAWVDAGLQMLNEGLVFWFPQPVEYTNNKTYAKAARVAQAKGTNLWKTDYCKSGPAQDVPISMWLRSDAEGSDGTNPNGEYVVIRNGSASSALPLSGFRVRDSSLSEFAFPSSASIPAGGQVIVHVGARPSSDTDTTTHFYWNHVVNGKVTSIFENAGDKPGLGDGAYLFDKDGDLRASFTYPCVSSCSTAAWTGLKITNVDYVGSYPNDESVTITNTSSGRVSLSGVMLGNPSHALDLAVTYGGTLHKPYLDAGESLTTYIGKGSYVMAHDGSPMKQYWGLAGTALVNGGDTVKLQTFDYQVIDCKKWTASGQAPGAC